VPGVALKQCHKIQFYPTPKRGGLSARLTEPRTRAEQIGKGVEYFQSERERQRTVRQRISALQKANEKQP
jgi:hypothetical protein